MLPPINFYYRFPPLSFPPSFPFFFYPHRAMVLWSNRVCVCVCASTCNAMARVASRVDSQRHKHKPIVVPNQNRSIIKEREEKRREEKKDIPKWVRHHQSTTVPFLSPSIFTLHCGSHCRAVSCRRQHKEGGDTLYSTIFPSASSIRPSVVRENLRPFIIFLSFPPFFFVFSLCLMSLLLHSFGLSACLIF